MCIFNFERYWPIAIQRGLIYTHIHTHTHIHMHTTVYKCPCTMLMVDFKGKFCGFFPRSINASQSFYSSDIKLKAGAYPTNII